MLNSCTQTNLEKEKSKNTSFFNKCRNQKEIYRSDLKLFKLAIQNPDSVLNIMKKEVPTFIQDSLYSFYKEIINDVNYNIIFDSTYVFFGEQENFSNIIQEGMCVFQKYFKSQIPEVIVMIDDDIVNTTNPPFNPIFYNHSSQLILIQLQWFLGEHHVFYTNRNQPVPEYLRKRYEPRYIPSMVFQAMGHYYTGINNQDNKLLTMIINEAKPYFFTEIMLPKEEPHLIFGTTKEDLGFFKKHEQSMWKYMLKNKVLFSSNSNLKEQYIVPSNVSQLGAPSRFGVWIGWQILRAYFNNNNVTVIEVLEERDYLKILNNSNYKP